MNGLQGVYSVIDSSIYKGSFVAPERDVID